MAKLDPSAAKLKSLKALADGEPVADKNELLRESLADRSYRVVARAAEYIAETEDASYVAELALAYHRLKIDAIENDPGCPAKTAAIRALVNVEYTDAELYRDGIEYRQLEPVWGMPVDTAAELRGLSAIGLINSVSRAEVLNRCAVLLVDEYPLARTGAVRTIGALGMLEGAALLRFKLLTGDAEPDVLGECCSALIRLDRPEGVPFVLKLLRSPHGDTCVQAGLALGELRIAEAFEPLKLAWTKHFDLYVRRSLLLCIGLLRSDESREFLFTKIDRHDIASGAAAIKALHVAYGADDELKQRVATVVKAIGDASLKKSFAEEWRHT